MTRKTILAAVVGITALAGLTASAAPAAASASGSGATKPLYLRTGLTLKIPKSWTVHRVDKDWLRVVTGKCATLGTEEFGFRDSGCRSFWVFGPKAIKVGHNFFNAYNPDGPFYPGTDVGPCPYDKKLWLGYMKLSAKGVRQVGPGHKAHYRKWRGQCITQSSSPKVKGHFYQREWFLPVSKVLVVDQWNTPGLSGILKRATWS